mmetsp:Transcript_44611/g.87390  ORF Transcript_44611/g.87390 Transcript_44611/m.87390 type:complete len:600 (-) Transcript_44611:42-1841(-)|eukprot:CAMPEP_0175121746 /NCGR_PEP_ID=MMETSP0087-20121206/1335_1 /TAXON_ID=136419 /ORGANISM="Unknown Unknown, Strain D1" /LENGTH=599 /DNA_ID=CAMNT_0016403313 /DNA_START=54 /DNA_END=1853 /DNA_ORIENTATION=-
MDFSKFGRRLIDGDKDNFRPHELHNQKVLRSTLEWFSEPGNFEMSETFARSNVSNWKKLVSEEKKNSSKVEVLAADWGDAVFDATKRNGVIYAALNMADAYTPGGGYVEGSAAQEENMFRRTNCHFFIDHTVMQQNERYHQGFSDLINAKNGMVYLDTQRVRVCVRGNEASGYRWLPSGEVFPFFELRAAADNLRGGGAFNRESSARKIEAQFKTLVHCGVRHVVLSAFGCGAFKNPPEEIATLYRDAVLRHHHSFDHIVFAVYVHPNYGPDNFTPFATILNPVNSLLQSPALSMAPPQLQKKLDILHLSDTHNLHRTIEARFPLPSAHILLHTGDFTNRGTEQEIADFNDWLGEIRPRFKYILVILGNHDVATVRHQWLNAKLDPSFALEPQTWWQQRLPNCSVLHHQAVNVEGLSIFGSSWDLWLKSERPGDDAVPTGYLNIEPQLPRHNFHRIPTGIDILLTHGPARNIFDCIGANQRSCHIWGSSDALTENIWRAKPKLHLFGHLHEQRGVWVKTDEGYVGGVEYCQDHRHPTAYFPTVGPPPVNYPCSMISCNAMKNHPDLENKKAHIAGPARLITATQVGQKWHFSTSSVRFA